MNKNKSIIFFDIDGTLMDETTLELPETTIKAIKCARKNGHLAYINTGRTVCQLSSIKKLIDFDGFICGCGTYIEHNNEALFHTSIGVDLTKKLVQGIDKYKVDAALESINGVYYDNVENIKHKEIFNIIDIHDKSDVPGGNFRIAEDLDIDKLVIFINEESDFDGFYEEFKNIFDFIQRSEDFYELVPLKYSKATGIQYIIDHLNIPFDNTYAIGDSTNDLTMLKYVKNSIAMGNSTPVLFDLVSFVTKDINDDGIYHALSHYNLI